MQMTAEEIAAYCETTSAKLDQWQAELDKFRAQAREAQAEGRLQLINSLDTLHQEAKARLEELKAAGDSGWQAAQQAVQRAVVELDTACQRLVR